MLKVAFPAMLQQFIIVVCNLADTVMVGRVSEYALAAVGAANQIFFVILDCTYGFLSGCAVFAVQYWGLKDLKSMRKILGIAVSFGVAFSIVATALVYSFAPFCIGIFTKDPLVIELGVEYIRIACFTYIINALSYTIAFYSRATMLMKWPTIFNGAAVIINIVLNYMLIFGKCGMPELGVKGAAIATVIARAIECICLFIYIYTAKDHPLAAKLSELKFDKELLKRVMKRAWPVVFNEGLWVISFSATFAIYGQIGPIPFAVVQVAMTISDIFQCVYLGLGNGGGVVIGHALGRGDRDKAYAYGKKMLQIGWIISAVLVVLLILVRGPIAAAYKFEAETTELLLRTLVVFAFTMVPKMFSFLIICGILRPGGDTLWCLIFDVGINWIIQVPLALISVFVLKLDLEYCVAVVAIADVIKMIFSYIRFGSAKWINVLTGKE